MPADPVPHHARATAVWLTGCLRDAARPRDLNFGDLRHFETNIDPIREPNWPAKTIKDLERVFWTNKVKKHGYPPQTWRLFGFQDATTGLSSCCTTFCTGVLKNYRSHRGPTHDLSRIMESKGNLRGSNAWRIPLGRATRLPPAVTSRLS